MGKGVVVPSDDYLRLQWAKALLMSPEELKKGQVVCKKHFIPHLLQPHPKRSGHHLKPSTDTVPLPWQFKTACKLVTQCPYIRGVDCPDPPFNRFVQEQIEYVESIYPKMLYNEVMAKIEENWADLSDEQKSYYHDSHQEESEVWKREHSLHHNSGEEPCLTFEKPGSGQMAVKEAVKQKNVKIRLIKGVTPKEKKVQKKVQKRGLKEILNQTDVDEIVNQAEVFGRESKRLLKEAMS